MNQTNDPFIGSIGKLVQRLEDAHGPLFAALLIRFPDRPKDEWVLLVGSRKLVKRRLDGIGAIVDAMQEVVPPEFATRVRHVDVLGTDHPLYTRLSRAFNVELGAQARVDDCHVFGLEIQHAVLFVLKQPPPAPRRKDKGTHRPRSNTRTEA